MQDKVLVGGTEGLLDLKEKQDRMLIEKQLELERQLREEERLKHELEERQEEAKFNQNRYKNLEEEIDVKTRKLKKVIFLSDWCCLADHVCIAMDEVPECKERDQ